VLEYHFMLGAEDEVRDRRGASVSPMQVRAGVAAARPQRDPASSAT
jgi:hypothetical protein